MLDLADRRSLIASLPHGGVCAEIGVAEGCLSGVILEVNEPARLYLIDSWKHQSKEVVGNDPANIPQEGQEGRYAAVCNLYGADPRVCILRKYSLEAAADFEDETFDWWHIDANHLQLRQDLEAWWPKLKRGGWATGHDYAMAGDFLTVKRDVDLFVAERGLHLLVTRGDTDVYEKNYPTWILRKP